MKHKIIAFLTTHCEKEKSVVSFNETTQCEGRIMDIAKTLRELRKSTGMSRKNFSEHTGIPVRTLEDWEAGRRTPPVYIPRLIS